MADNVGVSTGTGATVAAEDIGGVEFQRVKLVDGLAGSTGYIQATTGVPGAAATGLVVAVIPGASVTVSGQVVTNTGIQAVNVSGIVPVVTQASVSVSGMPVWMNPTQGVTILGTQIVKGTVDVVPGVSVTISGQIVTNTGIQAVNISGIVPVITQPSVSVSGLPVYLNPTQAVVVNTIAAGFSVSALVSISAMPVVSMTGALVSVVSTILGTQVVTIAQTSVSVAVIPTVLTVVAVVGVVGVTAISVLSTVVTVLSTVIVTHASYLYTAGTPTQASTAHIVVAKQIGFLPVMIVVTSTAGAVSMAKYLFTIWTGITGAPAAAGTTSWAVPAGKTLRLMANQAIINSSAVTGGTVQVYLGVGATASMVSASISTQLQLMKLQVLVSAGPVAASLCGMMADVAPGESIAAIVVGSTAHNIQHIVMQGYLF